jgi:cellulose synthase operon protein B
MPRTDTRPCAQPPRLTLSKVWLLLAVLFASWTPPAFAGAGRYSIQFQEHLKVSNDLKLKGARSSSSLRFTCESNWKPIAGSLLHLFIAHSPDLDSSRSFLSVTLNYGVLRSLRLDEHNQGATEITIPLPPEMLRRENEIVFSVEQFPNGHANDIWTIIKPSSFISIEYEEDRPTLDLRELPSPLVDRGSYRPKEISVLLPDRPSSQTLEANALLIANYAANLKEALAIHAVPSIDAASDRLLIVGTPQEQPLRLLESQLPFRLIRTGNKTGLGIQDQGLLDAREGIVALTQRPGKKFNPILLVSGNGPDGVLRATRKLIEGHFEGPGTFARISHDVRLAPLPPRNWTGFIPPSGHFELAQLGLKELKLDAQNEFSIALQLSATPDAKFLPYGHQMTLRFRLSSATSVENAQLDLSWNGSTLGRFPASEFSAGASPSLHVTIPAHLLQRQNVLNIAWRGLDSSETAQVVWLLPSTEFDLPRDYQANLPDLALLQSGLFPFGLRSDLSDLIVVVPDGSSDEVTAAVFELAGALGRLVRSDRFAFSVQRLSELKKQSTTASHLIALRTGEQPKGALATIEESVSPWNDQKYLLSITANSPASLRAAIKMAFSGATLKQLQGDTAHIYPDRISSFRIRPVRLIHEYAYFMHLQAWLRTNWIALPVILTSVSGLLFVGLRLALAQYKNRVLSSGLSDKVASSM